MHVFKSVELDGLCKLSGLALLALGLSIGLSKPAAAELTSAELVEALQTGGNVVYMRHTRTEKGQEDLDHTNLANCETQRNLSAEGRDQARVIAEAIASLRIDFEAVLTSPYCRARDTATLAFGGGENTDALRYLSHQPENERPGSIEAITRMLSTPPQNGGNTVLVSHTENLKQAAGIWPKDSGEMHVFKPQGNGSYEHLGKIGPEEWAGLADSLGTNSDRTCIWVLCW